MVYDPTDLKHRKPRRMGNTPLRKYIRIISLSVTCFYAFIAYLSFRKNVFPYMNDERYKVNLDELDMMNDYRMTPFMRGTIEKLIERREAKDKAEAKSEDTQVDK